MFQTCGLSGWKHEESFEEWSQRQQCGPEVQMKERSSEASLQGAGL